MSSELPDGWETKTIGDIAKVVGGGTPKSDVEENWGGDVPWLTPRDLRSHIGRYVRHGERHLTRAGLESSSARLHPTDTVLVSSRAPIGYVAIAANPIATNQGFRSLVLKDGIDAEFAYWVMLTKTPEMTAVAGGSTFKEISGKALKSITFPVPPHSEQRAIAEILGSLDDRIAHLVAARQLIRRTVESAYECLPFSKYSRQPVGEIFPVSGGGTPSTKDAQYWGGGHPWLTPRDLSDSDTFLIASTRRSLTDAGLAKVSSGLLPRGTVAMSSRAPIGHMAIFTEPCAVNQGFIALPPVEGIHPFYTFAWLSESLDEVKARAGGSTFAEISKTNFRPILMPSPVGPEYNAFAETAEACLLRLTRSESELHTLVSTRDALLPELVSGRLRISDVDGFLERAGLA